MMSKYDIRQTQVEAFFNPEDVTKWAKLTPVEAIARILPEIMECVIAIERMATVIHEHPDVDSSAITWGGKMTLKEMAEKMKIESLLIARILRTIAAYKNEYLKSGGQSDNIEPNE